MMEPVDVVQTQNVLAILAKKMEAPQPPASLMLHVPHNIDKEWTSIPVLSFRNIFGVSIDTIYHVFQGV